MPLITDLNPTAEDHWQRWLAWAGDRGVAIPEDAGFEDARRKVFEASDYVAVSCAQVPESLGRLIADGDLVRSFADGEQSARLTAELAGVSDDDSLRRVLRHFRRRQMVRIIWRDLAGWATLAETLEDLSALAEACICCGLEVIEAWAHQEVGTPRDAEGRSLGLVVLGMGKLGARELNLSSDIDLIFAYPATGQVEGPRSMSNEQFFIQLARRLVQALDAQTVDGFVFRVDVRLRPFGDSGPLAMSFRAMEDYYQSQAREWERYAMIKARVIAGAPSDAEYLSAMLRPFVYRRYLDFGAIESLRDMKQLIDRELQRKGMADNVKLGPGGIREIEFIGQSFQLIRGGRDPDLQIRPILQVLRLLGDRSLLPAHAVRQLSAAYEFLRLVENRVQAWKDKQTHLLPEDGLGRLRLARSMGFADWDGFFTVLEEHRRRVQGQFDQAFAAPHAEESDQEPFIASLWRGVFDPVHAAEVLAKAGFKEPETALRQLELFRDAVERKGLSKRGSERLAQLMPLLLQVLAGSDHADVALERILRVLEVVVRRTAYLAMLVEHPLILTQMARLASMSPWITDRIARHPLLLDELIDPRRLYAPLRRDDLRQELDGLLDRVDPGDLEQQMERLRQFAQGNMLRVAAADLTGAIPLMIVSDYLTEIAETSVAHVLRITEDYLYQRHGHPTAISGADSGFLVLGYGKLGGIELGYGSDLDLVFLHGSETVNAVTDGVRPISNEQFYNRLGQRMIHTMTTPTASGSLYEVDMRLRPDGNRGMLVRSIESFANYQVSDAWTWEHQALVRARPVAGDSALAERFQQIRRQVLCLERDTQSLCRDVRDMRARMRDNLDRSKGGLFDLKQGRGGIADIEFMVQYSVLRWAARHPELADWTDNIRLLETLARLDLLPGNAADALTFSYKALRAAYHRSALREQPTMVDDDALVDERGRVRALWAQLMETDCG